MGDASLREAAMLRARVFGSVSSLPHSEVRDMKQRATAALVFLVALALVLARVKWFPGFHDGR